MVTEVNTPLVLKTQVFNTAETLCSTLIYLGANLIIFHLLDFHWKDNMFTQGQGIVCHAAWKNQWTAVIKQHSGEHEEMIVGFKGKSPSDRKIADS